jgi:hypothetical protein
MRMKEPYIEGLANHDDPESCVGTREGNGEALTGARTGWLLSREIKSSGTPTLLTEAEGNTTPSAIASSEAVRRGRRPHARTESFCSRTGRSTSCLLELMVQQAVSGRPEATRR